METSKRKQFVTLNFKRGNLDKSPFHVEKNTPNILINGIESNECFARGDSTVVQHSPHHQGWAVGVDQYLFNSTNW